MKTVLIIIQIIITILLIASILMQSKSSGLSPVFGGSSFYSSRRGVEKFVFIATVVLSVLFLISSILGVRSQ